MGDFPAYLRHQLDARDWNQADLARHAEVHPTLVSRWLKGAVEPGIDNCRAIAGALCRPVLEVLVAAGILIEEEARQPLDAKDAPARRGGPLDVSVLTDDQLVAEVRRRMRVVDGARPMTRAEAEAPGMVPGRPKKSRAAKV
jgi:transcriptional regulator with XRE-family HTH domain